VVFWDYELSVGLLGWGGFVGREKECVWGGGGGGGGEGEEEEEETHSVALT
jgi:hypothetical protein